MKLKTDLWALILGGSSGFGLATAKKLSRHGMNLCIVHRDRKGAMDRIEREFDEIRKNGVQLVTYNGNALTAEGVKETLDILQKAMGDKGSVRMVLHSIAYGNLKVLAPQDPGRKERHVALLKKLGGELQIDTDKLQKVFDQLFSEDNEALMGVASPPEYKSQSSLLDGGRVVFSSGDVVFSSTALINAMEQTVDPAHSRLRQLIAQQEIDVASVDQFISSFRGKRVVVVGAHRFW